MSNPLPTKWSLYNLRASPFFQDVLQAGEQSPQPLDSLFVGREGELRALGEHIRSAGAHGTRQALAGLPGVGKTTIVQELKSTLLGEGYLSTDSWASLVPEDTSASLFGRMLGQIYDTLLANRPHMVDSNAMRQAQALVRTTRLLERGVGLSAAGFGAHLGQSETVWTPSDIMIDGPRVVRDLMLALANSDAAGLIVHVNNFETLSERDVVRAAETIRALRDPMLMHDRLHVVFVGTTDAIQQALQTHVQVRNVTSVLRIEPLDTLTVHALLRARYDHLRRDPSADVIPPVTDETVEALHALYQGDLRGLLKALDDGVSPSLGLMGAGTENASRQLTLEDIAPVLKQRYGAELDTMSVQTRVRQLRIWGSRGADAVMTQKDLSRLWGIKQPSVSAALQFLTDRGYVVALPREGGEEIRYVLSGTSRLIFL